jgi:uncharacterized membrane protein YesL
VEQPFVLSRRQQKKHLFTVNSMWLLWYMHLMIPFLPAVMYSWVCRDVASFCCRTHTQQN